MTGRLSILLVLSGLITGCSLLGGDKDTSEPPAELESLRNKLRIHKLWSVNATDGEEDYLLGLEPTTDGSRVFVASHDGVVVAIDLADGDVEWKTKTKLPLAGGPSVGEGIVVAGSSDGEVIALAPSDGRVLWIQQVSSEVVAPPALASGVVAVRSVSGRLHGLSVEDGSELWVIERPVPQLSLRGNGSPAVVGSTVITGFDNGRLVAADIETGRELWEYVLSTPSGRNPLDRLVDIDADVVPVGRDVYAVSFQGRAALISAETGDAVWTRDVSSYSGLGASWTTVFVVDESSEIVALSRANGVPVWGQSAFRQRRLTAPTPYRDTIVVGDLEGYVHWLSDSDGEQLARVRVGRDSISSQPVVVNDMLVVLTDGGQLAAYEVVVDEN